MGSTTNPPSGGGGISSYVSFGYDPKDDDKYYTGQNIISDLGLNRKGNADSLLRIHPFYLKTTATLKDVAIMIYTIGYSHHVRWGIWKDDGLNGNAGTLVFDSGKQQTNLATGWLAVTDTTELTSGKYWFGTVSTYNASSPCYYHGAGGKCPTEGMSSALTTTLSCNYHQGFFKSTNTYSIDSAFVDVDTEVFVQDDSSNRDGQIAVWARFEE
jgi:hypothetical protein